MAGFDESRDNERIDSLRNRPRPTRLHGVSMW
jgi:hypothetical protein